MSDFYRKYRNFSNSQYYTCVMNKGEVDYWLSNYDQNVFCNGRVRRVVFMKITDNNYNVKSEAI